MKNLFKMVSRQYTSNKVHGTHFWNNTGDVLYLMDTLKLSYRSSYGLVTIENIATQNIDACVQRALSERESAPDYSATAQPVELEVCGMTWERCSQTRRVRGIPKAATMRFFQYDQCDSDIKLYPNQVVQSLLHQQVEEVGSELASLAKLNVRQFVDFLCACNQRVSKKYCMEQRLKKQNFQSLYSEHEQRVLDQSINDIWQQVV